MSFLLEIAEFKILLLVYRALAGLAPRYISDMLSVYHPGRSSGHKVEISPMCLEHFLSPVRCISVLMRQRNGKELPDHYRQEKNFLAVGGEWNACRGRARSHLAG
ncbi:hypothetical protein KUCAC02_006772 [Chaenocephalus aceratus]|uniref:Uncharacterized protein n=1 Tax=Chaenocephalus aceratus TaxID=36190 RepID=A0ACB9VU56_CHAAC|nr:hypothetical protein KUCAC02_006772 [Chaenocephalus aceratus]